MFFINPKVFLTSVLFTFLCIAAHALPKEVEADRLQLVAVEALKAGNYAAAVDAFASIEALNISNLPQSFPFHYGVALSRIGKYDRALAKLELYLNLGTNTKFYREALEAYNGTVSSQKAEIEEARRKSALEEAGRQAEVEKARQQSLAEAAKRQAADSARLKAEEAAQKKAAGFARFHESAGSLIDSQTGLSWTSTDSGPRYHPCKFKDSPCGVAWDEAVNYCMNLGNGWRLPSVSEFQSICDKSQRHVAGYNGASKIIIDISPKFTLDGTPLWTNEDLGDLSRVFYISGSCGAERMGKRVSDQHVLCVREPQ